MAGPNRKSQPCGHYKRNVGHCHATEDVRPYPIGWRCPAHTPAAVAGEPEVSGQYCAPGRCYCPGPECRTYGTRPQPELVAA